MSLPLQAVERLFERLTATYGRQFLSLYEGLDANAIKTSWAHELSGFAGNLHAVAWALEHLPERAPNAIEFRNLCRKAPEPDLPKLPLPKADPERVRDELAKLGVVREQIKVSLRPNVGWASAIVAKHESGGRVAALSLRMAREVLEKQSRKEAA